MAKKASKRSRIGFIGLGDIGLPMAVNIARAGFDLTVFDLRKPVMRAAVRQGAKAAGSLAELARECEYICVAVVNETQMERLVSGPEGIFANAKPGSVVIAHSTMPPAAAEHFAARAHAAKLEWLDAPMSGASPAAKAATLSFLVGGPKALLDRCRPVLNSMGTNIFLIGPVGTGQVAKLVNGLLLHVGYVATLEAMQLADAYGVAEDKIIALAKVSTGNSWAVQHWGHMDWLVDFHSQGPDAVIHTHMRKDIVDALIAAKASATSMPMTGIAMEIYPTLVTERREKRLRRKR